MSTTLILALLAGAGVFLAFNGVTAPRVVRLERPRPERGPLGRLQAQLDAAELPVSASEFLTLYGVLALATAGAALFLGAPALALAGLIVVPALLWQRYESRRDDFLQKYNASLSECVQLLREGFSATGSLRDALDHAVRNGPDPAAADFREVWTAQATGKQMDEAFGPIVERRHNPFLRMVAEALTLKATEGGDINEVLLGLENMIRGQVHLRREISAKQAQARLESVVVSLAPVGFFLAMKLLPWMREYEAGFYSSFLGQIVLALVVVLSMMAFFLARRLAVRGLTMDVKELAPAIQPGEVAV